MKLSTIQSCMLSMITIFPLIQLHKYVEAGGYDVCKTPFRCGNLTLGYPFYDEDKRPECCGYPGFKVKCGDGDRFPEIELTKENYYYLVNMSQDSLTISVARQDDLIESNICTKNLYNTAFNPTLYNYSSNVENVTLYYDCKTLAGTPDPPIPFSCPNNRDNNSSAYFFPDTNNPAIPCASNIVFPVNQYAAAYITNPASLSTAIRSGFDLQLYADNTLCDDCRRSLGECGHNKNPSRFTCYCVDGAHNFTCGDGMTPFNSIGSKATLTKSKIALLGSFSAIGIGILVVLVYYMRLRCLSKEVVIWRKRKHEVEAFLSNHGAIGLQRYTYSDLKKLTNSFRDKLGEGGYGAVYKGKVQNTSDVVAVKILKKAEKNAEDFINEVASIGKTNHVNVVTLLGFCYESRHPALVYDFMPNGSLEKYLYNKNNPNSHSLSWEELFRIAVGIARGLEYLHRGCNTRIVHFDIKPHNILLDENFCPKISDFGLAKLCPQKESLVSLSEARGTVGYIAPEVFIRSFGGVSLKSDVYSYGMLVLEMVGCRRQAHSGGDEHGSEQYFPQYIYEQLEVVDNEKDMMSGEEKEIQKKMILVSLCCVKTYPSSRPEMSKVVEMLEGNIESLQAPPISSLALSTTFGGSPSSESRTLFRSFSVTPTL